MAETAVYSLVVASIFLVYFDATKNKIGKIPDEKRFTNMSAGMWALGTGMLWIIVFPLYLINRNKLKQKADQHPQEVNSISRNIKLGILGVLFLGSLGAGFIESSLLTDQTDLVTEISGVWTDGKGSMVTIDIASAQILIDDHLYLAEVKSIDNENKIISVNILMNQNEEEIWTIRQVSDGENTFHLVITLHNGLQYKLGFVRNLD